MPNYSRRPDRSSTFLSKKQLFKTLNFNHASLYLISNKLINAINEFINTKLDKKNHLSDKTAIVKHQFLINYLLLKTSFRNKILCQVKFNNSEFDPNSC